MNMRRADVTTGCPRRRLISSAVVANVSGLPLFPPVDAQTASQHTST